MSKHLYSLFFILFFTTLLNAQSRVIGGTPISNENFKKFDFVVGIGSIRSLQPAPNEKDIFIPFCTGTLISPTWVLTAGHCLASFDMFVYAKTNHLFNSFDLLGTSLIDNHKDGEVVKVRQVFYPYDFNLIEVPTSVLSVRHDIALLELDRPIIIDNYPKLANQNILNDALANIKQADLLGWGRLGNGKRASALMHTTLDVIDYQLCSTFYKNPSRKINVDIKIDVDDLNDFDKNIICAKKEDSRQQAKGACSGDSGAGLVYTKDNIPYIIGVLSNGSVNCGVVPDKYMNVVEYIGYIQDILKNKSKNTSIKKDILRQGFIEDLPSGFHMLGIERNIDYKSDIFKNVKSVWVQNKDSLSKIDIEDGHLPHGVIIRAKSGFWIQK